MALHGTISSSFPTSIDVNPTAKCNLACEFCWGPDHSIPDSLSTEQWKNLIKIFALNGTRSIVFTGGEPLVRPDIDDLIKFSKEQGMRVTLSTNTLMLKRRKDQILPYIDEIGVPLDGSSQEKNSLMRLGNIRAFQSSIEALEMLSAEYPKIEVTIRTVVSKVNKNDIESIGSLLEGKMGRFDRWKLYQFTPVSIGSHNKDKFEISDEVFKNISKTVIRKHPKMSIVSYSSNQRVGRYVFLGPEGNIFGVGDDGNYLIIGNYLTMSTEQVIAAVSGVIDVRRNGLHGHRIQQ